MKKIFTVFLITLLTAVMLLSYGCGKDNKSNKFIVKDGQTEY